jgi:3-oxoacyl-[acyl-carrier protein] reductase
MNAIVTGATKGIGKAIATKLAEDGYNLSICSRNQADLDKLKKDLAYTGVAIFGLPGDGTCKEAVYEFCRFSAEHFSQVDLLVNNAGIFIPSSFLDEADESYEKQLNLNLSSAYYMSKFFGRMMRNQRSGHIVNICSIASKEIMENAGSYSVTKTALLSLNHVLRKELAIHNVKVTAILPGPTFSASWEGTTIPEDKFVKPEEIAESLSQILKIKGVANIDELIVRPIIF